MKVPLGPSEHPNQLLRKLGAQYDPDLSISDAFRLVGLRRGWKQGSKTWKRNWNACMNSEYDRLIGCRVSSLATWQQLCAKVGIKDSFSSITQCKKVRRYHYLFSSHLLTIVGPGPCPCEHRRCSRFLELRCHPNLFQKQGRSCCVYPVQHQVLWPRDRKAG